MGSYWYPGYHYNRLAEAGRCLANTLCCMLCLGPILVIVGIALIASSTTDSRANEISTFTATVNSWDSTGFNTFSAYGSGGADFRYSINSGVANLMPPQSVADVPAIERSSDVPTYTNRLTYSSSASVLSSSTFTLGFSWNGSTITTQSVPAVSSRNVYMCRSSDSINYCQSLCTGQYHGSFQWGGSPGNSYCTIKTLLSQVCIVVAAPGTPAVPTQNLPLGCVVDGYGASNVHLPSTAVNGLSLAGYTDYTASSTLPATIPFQVTVRSSLDPWVSAARVTKGSLYFGLSAAAKLRAGIGCLVAGFVFTGLVCALMRCAIRRCFFFSGRPMVPQSALGPTIVTTGATVITTTTTVPAMVAPVPAYNPYPAAVAQPPAAYYPTPAAQPYPAQPYPAQPPLYPGQNGFPAAYAQGQAQPYYPGQAY